MSLLSSSTRGLDPQDKLKKVDESLDKFSAELERTLPPGLNSRLTRAERALLRTYALFLLHSLDAPFVTEAIVED